MDLSYRVMGGARPARSPRTPPYRFYGFLPEPNYAEAILGVGPLRSDPAYSPAKAGDRPGLTFNSGHSNINYLFWVGAQSPRRAVRRAFAVVF